MPDGRVKLYVISRLLLLRREHAELFRYGSYTPLPGKRQTGRSCRCLCARVWQWRRDHRRRPSISPASAQAPENCLAVKRRGKIRGSNLPSGAKGVALRNVLTNAAHTATDGAVSVGDLFADFPAQC
jgi:maltooligosyltrehalose synthase